MHLQYLFAAGLGCDLAGAALLARGLLISNRSLRASSGTFLGFNPLLIVSRVEDKIAARVGLTWLLLGFSIQGGGYVADASGRITSAERSDSAAAETVAVGLLCLAVALGAYRLARSRLERRTLLQIACLDGDGTTNHDQPYAGMLLALGRHRWPPLEGEDETAYALRVWNISDPLPGLKE